MTQQELLYALLVVASTKEDLLRLIRITRDYCTHIFFSGEEDAHTHSPTRLREFLQDAKEKEEDKKILLALPDGYFSSYTKDMVYPLLDGLAHETHLLPAVTVYVPFTPSSAGATGIAEWFRKNIRGHILLDIKYAPDASGGCALVHNGIYYDYSLPYFMETYKEEILGFMEKPS